MEVVSHLEYKDSKSFLAVMVTMCRAILYPHAKLFSTAGGKEQASSIMKEKVNEICQLIPAFSNEIIWGRGKDASSEGKDYCCYRFKNKTFYDNIAAKESSRGRRRHGGTIEEVASMDGKILSEVIIPTMNISRTCADGTVQPDEVLNKSQIYVKPFVA